MNVPMRLSLLHTAVAIVACSLAAPLTTGAAEPSSMAGAASFVVLPETTSPDGRYAVAWGLPKHPEIWKTVQQGFAEPSQASEAFYAKVAQAVEASENYLVDLRAKEIVQKLSSNYWHLEDRYQVDDASQRDTFEAAWSPTSDLVITSHTHRWVTLSVAAARIDPTGTVSVVNLEPVLKPAALKWCDRSMKKARLSADSVFIVFSGVQHREGGKFSVTASGSQGGEGEWNADSALIDFTLEPSEKGLVAKVSDVRGTDDGTRETAGNSEDALAKADADLNRAYSALRKTLGATEAETLKEEQRAWLKKRDKIKDPGAQAEFVAERVKELEAQKR